MPTQDYLHGYSAVEQVRLREQSKILGSHVMQGVSFPTAEGTRILEVGCGVGAQTELLLEHFPAISVTSVDHSESQLEQARNFFATHPARDRSRFVLGDAGALPFADATFDGAFVCWVLEHLSDPSVALREIHRCLKPGAVIHVNEVFNQMHFIFPRSPELIQYYDEFNRLQGELGGDPFVGVKLGNLLSQSGFTAVVTDLNPELWDSRDLAGRKKMTTYWKDLLQSAAPGLLERKRVDQRTVDRAMEAVDEVSCRPDGLLFFAWVKARANKL